MSGDSKAQRNLNLEQQRQLMTAQRRLESGIWDFRAYHDHLTAKVYNTD